MDLTEDGRAHRPLGGCFRRLAVRSVSLPGLRCSYRATGSATVEREPRTHNDSLRSPELVGATDRTR